MSDKYEPTDYQFILKNGQPVHEPDTTTFRQFMDDRKGRAVELTDLEGAAISTVFIGYNDNLGDGPPILWETQVFGDTLAHECERYSSEEQARAGHAAMVERVRQAEEQP